MKSPTEKQIHESVIAHWRALGQPWTLVATIPNAKAFGQPGLTKGLFDLLVLGGNVGIGFIELKAKNGKVSEHQEEFRRILHKAGVACVVTFDRDEPISVLEAWGIVRKAA